MGTDHALEQENKNTKVLGGIRGIANKSTTLDNYFLVSPILNNIVEIFCDYFDVGKDARKEHYQLHGSTNTRYRNNRSKLQIVYENHNVNFSNTNDVFNIVSKIVLPAKNAKELLSHDEVVQQNV